MHKRSIVAISMFGGRIVAMALILFAAACGGSSTSNVQVSWAANRETAVNSAGGGYKVYYGKAAGFNVATASSVDAPFSSGAAAPTSAILQKLSAGTYFVKVVAYSRTSSSAPSMEMAVTVP